MRDGEFVGRAAETSDEAWNAVEAIGKTTKRRTKPHLSSEGLGTCLKARAQTSGEGRRGPRLRESGDVDSALTVAKTLAASYEILYGQHAPTEPRAAVAEWDERRLPIRSGTQRPWGVHAQLMEDFRLKVERTRVIVPDTGGRLGGKHSGEVAIEAARLAKAAGKPVSLLWTRAEEFAWAYFLPAAACEARAGLVGEKIAGWDFTAYNPGTAGIETPYAVLNVHAQYFPRDSPVREGSYSGIGATGNNFAPKVFMDEVAGAAALDPLEFLLANLDDKRLSNVL